MRIIETMSNYQAAGNPECQKELILRLDADFNKKNGNSTVPKPMLFDLVDIFRKYFNFIRVFDSQSQESWIRKYYDQYLQPQGIMFASLDTQISFGDIKLRMSRNYDKDTQEFLGYVCENELLISKLPSNKSIALFDHDVVYGNQYKFWQEVFEKFGNTVEKYTCFEVNPDTTELLDSRDFLLTGNGIMLNGVRTLYQNAPNFEKLTSIPVEHLPAFKSDIEAYRVKYGMV